MGRYWSRIFTVTPAKTGIQGHSAILKDWIPAFAGMTAKAAGL